MDTDFDVRRAVGDFVARFREGATPERAENEKRYLKSELEHLGATVPHITKVCKGFLRERPQLRHDEVLALVAALWETRIHECRMAATELLSMRVSSLNEGDLPLVEGLIREARTWALVDPLAVNVVGDLAQRSPEMGATLDGFAADDDFWVRRTALLAHLRPLRGGDGDWERFTRYADTMLEEREFFIRKAIGWVLRETGKKRPDLVYAWIMPRAGRASGVTVREAVKWLAQDQRDRVMAAYRELRARR